MAAFDHLVIGAQTRELGAAWAKETLKADLPIGGAHPLMGTHNLLARLPVGYLEIISADPEAAAPARWRWYGLDDPAVRAAIATRPRPIGWVLAVDDIDAAAARAEWGVGEIITASRGDLTWRMAVREDGAVVDGVLPLLIEWPPNASGEKRAPTERMADLDLALRSLTLKHPDPERLATLLASVDAEPALGAAGVALKIAEAPHGAIEAMLTPPGLNWTL